MPEIKEDVFVSMEEVLDALTILTGYHKDLKDLGYTAKNHDAINEAIDVRITTEELNVALKEYIKTW